MSETKTSDQIRKEFFDFFQEKEHELVPSGSLVPGDDPTLLFTNAGMNQFKDVFLETGTRPYKRAVDTQKCLRVSGKHNDLEEVGLDTYHHTFFEMLGNWSFGDYFKKEAIAWAWELLVDRWGLDPNRLYATVHEGDTKLGLDPDLEAIEFWKSQTSINPDHILQCNSKDNFWMMGETGPCGPCSEIHVDLRTDEERERVPGASLVNADDPRVMEIWNLVFIQYNALGDFKLDPLSAQHVDTGMGFERIVAVLQGKTSNYDTDLFAEILQSIAELSPKSEIKSYENIDLDSAEKESVRIAMRVIADHIRTVSFAIADGAVPGNAGRGYVIRRILRRAVRFGYQRLGFRTPFMYLLVPDLVSKMGHVFPELKENQAYIERVIRGEEESFLETLGTGITFFEQIVPHIKALSKGSEDDRNKHINVLEGDRLTQDLLSKAYFHDESTTSPTVLFREDARNGTVPGPIAFLLHDTYGFPVDLTDLMAREVGLGVDMEGYTNLMSLQKARARTAANFSVGLSEDQDWQVLSASSPSSFVGYDALELESRVARYSSIEGPDDAIVHKIVFESTPFYAESGGQIGDTGTVRFDGDEIQILDTKKEDGLFVHYVDRLPSNIDSMGMLSVDSDRRARIAKNHTATHLVHAALRDLLGTHIAQKGSMVAPDRLRFDFNHFEKVDADRLEEISTEVNKAIQRNISLQEDRDVAYPEAIARGATALFGEKYGDRVRVITFDPDYSVELCGGTHVSSTGEIGVFRFLSEGSVASGVRRIEAVTGMDAVGLIQSRLDELDRAKSVIKSTKSIDVEIESLIDRQKNLQKEVAELNAVRHESTVKKAMQSAVVIGEVTFTAVRLHGVEMDTLRDIGTRIRPEMESGSVAILGSDSQDGEKAYLVAMVSDDLRAKVSAGKFVGQVAKRIDGGGGGRPELATAGGNSPEMLDSALADSAQILTEMLG